MALSIWTKRAALTASVMALSTAAFADSTSGDVQSELQALKARINELEAKQNENWLTKERASQIKGLVQEVIADAKTRGQFADGDVQAGYKDGFFIQSADKNYKLTVGGYAQVRYTYGMHQAKTNAFHGSNDYNSNGFEVREIRVAFSGNVVNPDITYKLELAADRGDSVTYSDAFIGYRINDTFKIRAGSYKAPFAKSQLTSDTTQGLVSRPEVLAPFDASRQLGVSLYGDIIKDTLGYEVMVSNGNGNKGAADTIDGEPSSKFDNRPAFYGRMQWAGSGKLADFNDESDLRKDNSNFIWLLGGAAGYESFNNDTGNYPGKQSTGTSGWGTNDTGSGFASLNAKSGDIYRATVDWSAKWQGWSFLVAGYGQQANVEPNYGKSNDSTLGDSSGFEYGAYGQVGYFILPRRLEVVGRIGTISSEGSTDSAQYYTIGANYYLSGHNAKIQTDLTWVPSEAAANDSSTYTVANSEALIARVQLQIKF